MTRGDRIIVAVVCVLAVASLPLTALASQAPRPGVTIRGPAGVTHLPPGEADRFELEGDTGPLVVEVRDGRGRVVAAECPDRICVHTGWSEPGRPVVCAPNGIVVESGDGGGLDAVSR